MRSAKRHKLAKHFGPVFEKGKLRLMVCHIWAQAPVCTAYGKLFLLRYAAVNLVYSITLVFLARGARSARADARLCTSSGINLIVPLPFHLVR